MVNLSLRNSHKLDIRPNPNGSGLNICIIEDKGLVYFGMNLIRKIARIPLYLFFGRKK